MGKRERREMGGWLNIDKFREMEITKNDENLCVDADDHTVENTNPGDKTDHTGENDHPVQEEEEEPPVQNHRSEEDLRAAGENNTAENACADVGTYRAEENDHHVEEKEKQQTGVIMGSDQNGHPVVIHNRIIEGGVTYDDLHQGNDHPVDMDRDHDISNPVDGDKLQGDDYHVVCDSDPRSASPGKEHPVEKIETEKIDHPVEEGI